LRVCHGSVTDPYKLENMFFNKKLFSHENVLKAVRRPGPRSRAPTEDKVQRLDARSRPQG
jgi:hypothetical protein